MGGVIRRLRNLSPTEFEHYVADLWEKRGFETEVTEASEDMGIDVIATAPGPEKNKTLIQAKKYGSGNRVNGPEVRQYAGLYGQERNVDNVVVVTTSGFTSQAKEVGRKANVELIGSTELSTLAEEYDMTMGQVYSSDFSDSDGQTDPGFNNQSESKKAKYVGIPLGILFFLICAGLSKAMIDYFRIEGILGAILWYLLLALFVTSPIIYLNLKERHG